MEPDSTPTLVTLCNDHLCVTAKSTGAELISIKSQKNHTEYLWQGDTITWADHAIVQFPIIGNLKNGEYEFKGQTYEMMSHGFARISDFEIVAQQAHKVTFQLKSNTSTLEIYPFEFIFLVTYELQDNAVKVSFSVMNQNEEDLYFSLGYHPGFNWPLKIGDDMEAYFLEFSEPEAVDRLVMRENLIDHVSKDFLLDTNRISLHKNLFEEDAIILKGIQSSRVSLKNEMNDRSVSLQFGEVPYLGIWSPKRYGNFVCLEPWFGIPDPREVSGNFKQKAGIKHLETNHSFDWSCTIVIH